jgi:sugar fermentation stimulation protein A
MTAPDSGGAYILFVKLSCGASLEVGRLGNLDFEAGNYAYVGSAQGPGGLAARLGRYLTGPVRKHWHIDYLLEHAKVTGTLFRADDRRRECSWAKWIGNRAKGLVSRFGSSDCHCSSHLFLIGSDEKVEEMILLAGCELKAMQLLEGDDGL